MTVALQAVLAGLSVGAVYGLVGSGFTLVHRLTRVLAFAHGDLVVGAVFVAVLAIVGTTPVAATLDPVRSVALVLAAIAAGAVLSGTSYLAAIRPYVGLDVTGWAVGGIAVGLLVRAALGLALPAQAYAVPDPLHLQGVLSLPGGTTAPARLLAVTVLGVVLGLVADRYVGRSRAGRAMRAVADDPEAASLVGVPVDRVRLTAFALAGALAGVAGLLYAPAGRWPSTPGWCSGSRVRRRRCSAAWARSAAHSRVGWCSGSSSSRRWRFPPSERRTPTCCRSRCSSSSSRSGPTACAVAGPVRVTTLAGDLYLLLAAIGLALAASYAGLPILGQGAFVAVGAFGVVQLGRAGWPLGLAVVGAVGIAAVTGYAVGYGAARLYGASLALATWALAWLAYAVLIAFPSVSGGTQGLTRQSPARLVSPSLGTVVVLGPAAHVLIAGLLCALALAALARAGRGPGGLELAALREGPAIADSLGVPVARRRRAVLATTPAVGATAGAGSAVLHGVVAPADYSPPRRALTRPVPEPL